jgi:2-keto-4-pentenoate hydratase/2-oxohepta-3-ene-1,7-dioic acid hydratase in catechol pathway
MRYCKLFLDNKTTAFASVTGRDHELFASALMPNPLAPEETAPSTNFMAVALSTLEREGRLLVPVTPTKIVCVGRNYRDHAAELGNDVPTEPLLFLKPPSSLLPAGGTIEMPAISKRVDFEGELAIVIGKRARKLTDADDVAPYIHGYTCLNDVTARDIQKSDPQWTRGKGFDTFCSVGPIVSDEIYPLTENVALTTRLNGEVKQRGETRDLIFLIAHLVRYISQCMTLEPGDLIATGTPAGVGPMKAGDVVEVEIAGLGTLRNQLGNC